MSSFHPIPEGFGEQFMEKTPSLDRVAILGLGLMGASLGMALRAKKLARSVVGYDVMPGVARRARARGAIDAVVTTPTEAVEGALLVVLAAPIMAMRDLLAAIAHHLDAHVVVTDLGSTKAQVVSWAEELLPHPDQFVGAHPMVGSERSGVEAAEASLYDGGVWCLTPTPRTRPESLKVVYDLTVYGLGASLVLVPPDQHDAAVAVVSHLPLLAATALTLAASNDPQWGIAQMLAAGGFRDTTRVASGDPRMARDICLTNSQPLLEALDAYLASLQRLRDAVAARDPDIGEQFAEAQRRRDAWLASRGGA
jgi:prephenate dehydrogenase